MRGTTSGRSRILLMTTLITASLIACPLLPGYSRLKPRQRDTRFTFFGEVDRKYLDKRALVALRTIRSGEALSYQGGQDTELWQEVESDGHFRLQTPKVHYLEYVTGHLGLSLAWAFVPTLPPVTTCFELGLMREGRVPLRYAISGSRLPDAIDMGVVDFIHERRIESEGFGTILGIQCAPDVYLNKIRLRLPGCNFHWIDYRDVKLHACLERKPDSFEKWTALLDTRLAGLSSGEICTALSDIEKADSLYRELNDAIGGGLWWLDCDRK